MPHPIRFTLASIVASALLAGCLGAPETLEEEHEVGTAEQPIPRSGYSRTYYTSSARTTPVGYEIRDCDNYAEADGERTNYYKEHRWSCPDNPWPFPSTTTCYDCITYTYPDGKKITSCTGFVCR